MAEPKKKEARKIIDVSHPGKSAPSGNSKSVIVGHGPMMKDPMVVESNPDKIEPPTEDLSKRTSKSVIQPLAADDGDISDEGAKKESKKDKSESTSKSRHKLEKDDDKKTIAALAAEVDAEGSANDDEDSEKSDDKDEDESLPLAELPVIDTEDTAGKDEDSKPKDDEQPDDDEDSEKSDDKDEEAASEDDSDESDGKKGEKSEETNPNELELEVAEKEKHDKEIQKLADSKQYFLPINTVEKRRNKRVVIFGILLSIILIIAWVDIALDAGLIELGGVEPVTSFFSN